MVDFEKSCRFCLTTTSEFAVNIFLDESGKCLSRDLAPFIPYKLQEIPKWPKKACFDCIEFLEEMVKFHKRSQQSIRTLQSSVGALDEVVYQEEGRIKCPSDREEELPKIDEFINRSADQVASCSQTAVKSLEEELETSLQEMPTDVNLSSEEEAADCSSGIDSAGALCKTPNCDSVEEIESINGFLDRLEYAPDSANHDSNVSPLPTTPANKSSVKRRRIKLPYSKCVPIELQGESNSIVFTSHKATEEQLKLEQLMVEMKLFVCKYCEGSVDTKTFRGLQKHLRETHPNEKYHICCKLLAPSNPLALYNHMRWHTNPDHFKCDRCDLRFDNALKLTSHKATHREKNIICDICGERFYAQFKYNIHYDRKHAEPQTCKYCGLSFKNKRGIGAHIRQFHEIDLTYLCEICGKGYASSTRLKSHISDHGGPHGGRRRKKAKPPNVAALPCDKNYFKMPDLVDGDNV